MRLIDLLETENLMAKRASVMRDYKATIDRLQKVAEDKTAGPMVDKVMNLLTRPFRGGPAEQLIATAKNRELAALQALLSKVPMDPVDIRQALDFIPEEIQKITEKTLRLPTGAVETTVEKTFKPGVKNEALQNIENLQRARQGLEKGDSKLPFKAVLGLIGADAAIGAGTLYVSKKLEDKAHKETMDTIAGDPQIPASLRGRAKEMYGILARYAPSIAKDPVFAKDFTKNLIRHDTVDHKVIQDLTSMEKTYREAKGRKAEFIDSIRTVTLKSTGWF